MIGKKILVLFSMALIFLCQGCASNEAENGAGNYTPQPSGGDFSTIDGLGGIRWGDGMDDALAALDGAFEYEIVEPEEGEILTSVRILNGGDFSGLAAEKILNFKPVGDGESVLVDVSYGFESYDEAYSLLTRELGEPDNVDESNPRVGWTLAKVGDVCSESEIENVYEALGYPSAESLKNETAESYMLYNAEGKGYLIDDGSVMAMINRELTAYDYQMEN